MYCYNEKMIKPLNFPTMNNLITSTWPNRVVGCQGLLEEIPSRMTSNRKESLVPLPSSEPRTPASKSNRYNKNKYAIKEDLSSKY